MIEEIKYDPINENENNIDIIDHELRRLQEDDEINDFLENLINSKEDDEDSIGQYQNPDIFQSQVFIYFYILFSLFSKNKLMIYLKKYRKNSLKCFSLLRNLQNHKIINMQKKSLSKLAITSSVNLIKTPSQNGSRNN